MRRLAACSILLCPTLAPAQQFVRNTTDVPASSGWTEQIDFADVDLDGDWDAGFANGGDFGNQQNVLWINLGGAQGGVLGVFANQTATRFPAILDASRDLEFADYDGDGDPDIAIANHSALSNQPSRLWTNLGGAQGGTMGFYADQTAARWIGLGAPGSSIPPGQVLAGGGFLEHPNDLDFADFDDDGDLDFVQSTFGASAIGNAPTRLFVNDGAGFFTEFNPSGFQLAGANIVNGNPGLWCQGTQSANTLDATGTFCDIATSAISVTWGDVDGDLDLDLLLGARQEVPRLFHNRLAEDGVPGFRDVTGASFVAGYATGAGHYEECFGDFDGDDDLDIYGVNWLQAGGFQFPDLVLRNSGAGYFDTPFTIPGSGSDDDSAEPLDYDLDGDLDVYVANFSGAERLVRNDGGWTFSTPSGVLQADTTTTVDADSADVDGDGDYDVFDANSNNQAQWYRQNLGTATDTTPPRLTRLQQAPDRLPSPTPTVVRCQVYDNAPQQLTQWRVGTLELQVNGIPATGVPLRSSFGQVFRAEIPGSLVGVIEYRATLADEHGNQGASPWLAFTSGDSGSLFCPGDGTGTPCPCGNDASAGRGCGNSLGAGARLEASGVPSVAADSLVLDVFPVPNSSVLFFQGTAQVNGGAGSVFGDGLRCAGGALTRLATKTASSNRATYPVGADVPVSVRGGVPASGGVRTYQAWYRNAADFCTPSTFNLSNGWQVVWVP
ncbi:MAG: VCBS repeat-containing protein [Planctomycetes bacterium]|nr:VCBS repeat-containing protein [Planctomycetota bacterium]